MLILCVIALLLAFILEVRGDGKVFIRWIPAAVMPGSCLSRELFHFDCPGCGLTRSVVHLAHGRLADAWRMHRIGIVMALLMLAQIPYRIACLRHERLVLGRRIPLVIGYSTIALLFLNWFAELLWPGIFAPSGR